MDECDELPPDEINCNECGDCPLRCYCEAGYLEGYPVIYLTAAHPNLPNHIGIMTTPMAGNLPFPDSRIWAADTGCFLQPERYDDELYLAWLDHRNRTSCLFATAPDVVRDAAATLELSAPMLPSIRALGYPAALVAQDGLEGLDVPWDAFDCLFIGGTTAWKLSDHAIRLMAEAKRRGKLVHVGRVNSKRRFQWCRSHGADSADGTFAAFGPDVNIPRIERWLGGALQLPFEATNV
jgi:hypothetical protein